jgi:rfaE bifunctional protein nucleotidyltransferase chain/domain
LGSLQIIKDKIVSKDQLKWVLVNWKFKGEKIVFTNGCFDILHQGHVDYLSKASDKGSRLIVAVNSDTSLRKLNKGENRPLQDEYSRALIIASLQFVSRVIIFDEDTPFELISYIKPNVLVKGSDYSIEQIVGHDVVLKSGGTVDTIDFLDGYSTSKIVEKAKK